jgi:hypothetical protein
MTHDQKRFAFWLAYMGRNGWYECDKFKVYVRQARHVLNGKLTSTLDLANVEVYPQYQHRGLFNGILEVLESHNWLEAVYIENVLNGHLLDSLPKHGWTRVPADYPGALPSFFKMRA